MVQKALSDKNRGKHDIFEVALRKSKIWGRKLGIIPLCLCFPQGKSFYCHGRPPFFSQMARANLIGVYSYRWVPSVETKQKISAKTKATKSKTVKAVVTKTKRKKQRNHRKLLSKQLPENQKSRRFHWKQKQRTNCLVMIFNVNLFWIWWFFGLSRDHFRE